MSRIFIVAVTLLACRICAIGGQDKLAEVERARQYGAKGRVVIRVVDTTGKPVEMAKYSVALFPSDSYAEADVREGRADTNGCFAIEGVTVADMAYVITKDGHYRTEGKYWFYRQGENCVQGGCWQPWGLTNTIVLKERRNPIPMLAKRVEVSIPARDVPYGFDLEVGDWVVPHGKGMHADLTMSYSSHIVDMLTFSNQLVISCGNQANGLRRASKEMWSSFISAYEAPTAGYQKQVVLSVDRNRNMVIKHEEIDGDNYLIFRVRTSVDDKGSAVTARYGKIYGPIEYGDDDTNQGVVRFTYYFNPIENDRNLEYDPARNLFGQTDRSRISQP